MVARRYCLIRYEEGGQYLNIKQIAELCGVHPEVIYRFVQLGLIEPVYGGMESDTWLFDVDVIPMVKKIIRLRNDLGINYAGVGVVLELLNRLEDLERRIAILEEDIIRIIAIAST